MAQCAQHATPLTKWWQDTAKPCEEKIQ